MTMITPSYLGETIEYSSLHACRSTLEDPTQAVDDQCVSDTFLELVTLKRAMIRAASQTTLLIDSSRFAGRAIHSIAELNDIHEIITDDGLADSEYQQYRQLRVKITRVSTYEAASPPSGGGALPDPT